MQKTIRKTDILKVLLSAIIVEDGFNVRESLGEEDGSLDALARQIAAQGQKQPLKGVRRGDEVLLTAGHRRLEAIKIANEKYIGKPGYLDEEITEALVMTEKADDKARVFEMLIDGDGSRPLTNKEMVKGIERLLEMDVDQKEIIASLGMGKSQAQKYNLVAAAKTPKAIKKMIEEGVISVAKVNALQRKAGSDKELVELAEAAVAEGRKPKAAKTERKVSSDIATLEAALEIADQTTAKAALLKSIVNKLKAKASPEEIAKLLK